MLPICWHLCSVLPPKTTLVFMVWTACWRPVGHPWLRFWWRLCCHLWSVLPQEGILVLVISDASRKHVMLVICVEVRDQMDVSYPSCHQKSWGPWPVLLLESMWTSVICTATDISCQRSFFCSSIHDCRIITEMTTSKASVPPSPKETL